VKYRVISSRWDVQPRVEDTFDAKDDKTAKVIFEERYKKDKNLSWNDLELIRIDQEEKTTLIATRDAKIVL
jgi:hypothetical protein